MSRSVVAATAVVAGLLVAAEASACSCVRVDRATVIAEAEVAFRGVIVETHRSADGGSVVARVRVLRPIKGRVPRHVVVTSVDVPGLCGYPLRLGAELDFAGRFDADGRLGVGMCGMVPLNSATPRPR